MKRQAAAVILLLLSTAMVGAASRREENLRTCLSGKYPALCDRGLLTTEQLRAVEEAERRENLRTCLTGKYPALCKRSLLTASELEAVVRAERAENLAICLTGKYSALCRHADLTTEEAKRVRAAEDAENLRICMDGRYPALCKSAKLTTAQLELVRAAEERAASTLPTAGQSARRPSAGSCEEGHWIESITSDGSVIELEDGSFWEVDGLDHIISPLWLPITSVTLCGSRMINTDDNEVVSVTRLDARAGRRSGDSYEVEVSASDEIFVINGERFSAKTYCFGIEPGDRVIFVEGSANGTCTSAEFLVVDSGETCRVWCE